jgi:hypothetical protein
MADRIAGGVRKEREGVSKEWEGAIFRKMAG